MKTICVFLLCLPLMQALEGVQRTNTSCSATSGVQNITLSKGETFEILCNSDIAGPGWIVIQQRINGEVDFFRRWTEFRNGFGDFWNGDFFLGLEKVHELVTERPHELYIYTEKLDNSTYFARYDEFVIADENDQYRLEKLGHFHGNTTDELRITEHNKFITHDRGNNVDDWINCAFEREGAMWYSGCNAPNLNGRYPSRENHESLRLQGLSWDRSSLKQVKILIKPKAA